MKLARELPPTTAEIAVLEHVASDQCEGVSHAMARSLTHAKGLLLRLEDRGWVRRGPGADGEAAWIITDAGRVVLNGGAS